jgi:hypothetical protein
MDHQRNQLWTATRAPKERAPARRQGAVAEETQRRSETTLMTTGIMLAHDYIEVADTNGVNDLVAAVRDSDRRTPIVCVTSRRGEAESALDPVDVRRIVGDAVPIYFVRDGPLTRRLMQRLPPKLQAFGGAARIWWRGVNDSCDPHDHPLIQDRYGVYGSKSPEDLRRAWARGAKDRPTTVTSPELLIALRCRDQMPERLAQTSDELRAAGEEIHRARERASVAERRQREGIARTARPASTDTEPDVDLGAQTRIGIAKSWVAAFDEAERNERPLAPYCLGRQFLDDAAALNVAWRQRWNGSARWSGAEPPRSCPVSPCISCANGPEVTLISAYVPPTAPRHGDARSNATRQPPLGTSGVCRTALSNSRAWATMIASS